MSTRRATLSRLAGVGHPPRLNAWQREQTERLKQLTVTSTSAHQPDSQVQNLIRTFQERAAATADHQAAGNRGNLAQNIADGRFVRTPVVEATDPCVRAVSTVAGKSLNPADIADGRFVPNPVLEAAEATVSSVSEVTDNALNPTDIADGQFVRNPIEEMASSVSSDANPAVSEAPSAIVEAAKDPSVSTKVKTITSPNRLLAAIPFFAWLLYNSKETHLRNINIRILATPKRKKYCITLGKGETTQTVAFYVQAGKPVRFAKDEAPDSLSDSPPSPLFKSDGIVDLIWKRKDYITHLNVVIDDPFNPALETKPAIDTITLTSNEGLTIIHRDPHRKQPVISFDTPATADEIADFASVRILTVNVSNSIKCDERVSLANPEDLDTSDEFVRIVQS